jgi:glycine dehydrogenase subunit 1
MQELGQVILQKSQYAMKKIAEIEGVSIPFSKSAHFKEFVVNFNKSGKTAETINKALLKENIFGGKDITKEFTELENCAVYCITEIHSKEDIDRLAKTLDKCINGGGC